MTKNQGLILAIALMLLLSGIALATSTALTASSGVIIYAFDQNPAGSDDGNEWVTFHNPSNESVDIGNWTFESTHGSTAIDWIPEGTTLCSGAYYTCTPHYRWLDNQDESIILKDSEGKEVDRTPVLCDTKDDNRCWEHKDSEWVFEEFEKPTPSPTLKPPPLTPSPSPDYTSSPSPTPTPSPILTPAPTPSPSPGYTTSAIPTLSPSPDYTPSPFPTPHPNIYKNSNEKISLFAVILTIISSVLTIVALLGSFFNRKKERKSKTYSSGFFYLLIGSLVFLFIGIAIIIIDFITMIFTIIIAIFTGIIAISTIIIAIIAYLYVYCPKPNVVAYLRHKPLGIYVENVGREIALNCEIRILKSHEAASQLLLTPKKNIHFRLKALFASFFRPILNCFKLPQEGKELLNDKVEVLHRYKPHPIDGDFPKLVREERQLIVEISYDDDRGFHYKEDKKISIPQNLIEKLEK